jgi:hypothetical protein
LERGELVEKLQSGWLGQKLRRVKMLFLKAHGIFFTGLKGKILSPI